MKVLITGGAGFIGSHIADELLTSGYGVVIVDNLVTGHQRNVPEGATFYQEDIRNNLDYIFTLEKPDYVIHQAAQVSVSKSMQGPLYDGEANILATINLLTTCIKFHVKKMIFASTAAVYGNPAYLSIDEWHPLTPLSFYGLSKINAEAYIQLFSKLYGLNFSILRYANVYGMRQDANGEAGVMAIFIEKALKKQSPVIFGDGLQTRDFVFVKDIAKANIAALHSGDFQIFNIGTETKTPIIKILEVINQSMEQDVIPIYENPRNGDIRHSYLSYRKAEKLLLWQPMYSLTDGLTETINYYSKSLEEVK